MTLQETEKNVNTLTPFSSSMYKLINSIDQGDTATNRDGNVCVGKGFYIRGMLHNNVAYSNMVRLVVFEPEDDNVLADINTAGNEIFRGNVPETLSGLKSMYYPLNRAKFKKIWVDKVIKIGGFNSAANGSDSKMFRLYKKFNTRLIFNNNTAGSAPANAPLYFMAWAAQCDEDVVGGAVVEMSYLSSYYFVDV